MSFLAKSVTVTTLGQSANPKDGIIINAAASEWKGSARVKAASELTRFDGVAQFKIRFGFFSTEREITFPAESFTAILDTEYTGKYN